MTQQERARRNQNPHKAARLAMFKWGGEYAAQRGGSMDFWDSLHDARKKMCREVIAQIEGARRERGA